MRSPTRAFFVFLLVLGALFGGLACSGSGSKVSKSNVERLNAANKHILGIDAEMEAALNACKPNLPFSDKGLKCRGAYRLEYYAGLKSAMATYEQVANETADKKCQQALRQMALVIRVNVESLSPKTPNQASIETKLLDIIHPGIIEKTKRAMPQACDLEVIKAK
jgi:hypothetical protein